MVLPFFFPAELIAAIAGPEGGEEPSGEEVLRLIQIRFSDAEFGKNLAKLSSPVLHAPHTASFALHGATRK
jgi:hypothetical protein